MVKAAFSEASSQALAAGMPENKQEAEPTEQPVKIVARLSMGDPNSLALSSDGSFALVTNRSINEIVRLNLRTRSGVKAAVFDRGIRVPSGVAISANGSFAIVGNNGASGTCLLDLRSNQESFPFPKFSCAGPRGIARGVAIARDASFALVSHSNGSVGCIHLKTGHVEVNFKGVVGARGLSIAPDKKFALVASVTENSVACLHLDTGEVSFPYDGFNGPTDVAISDDGLFAVVANSGAGNLGYIDLHTQEVSFSSGPVAANFTEMRGLALVPGKYGPSSAVVVLARAHAGGDTVPFELMNFELPETLKAARAVAPLRGPMERFDAEAIRAVLDAESECSSQDATKGDTCNGLKGHAQKGISPDAPVLQRTPLHCNIADRSVQASVDGAYAAAREMLTRLDSEAPFEAQIRMSMEKCDLPTLRQVLDAVKERVAKGQLQVVEKGPLHKVLKDALRCLRNRTAAVEMFLVDRLGAEAVKSVTPHMMDSDYALLGELVDRCNTEAESALVFRDITSSGGDIKSQTEKVIRAKQVACKRSKESHSMEPGAAVQEAADLQRVLQTLASELHQASAHQSKIVAEVERAECSQSQQLLAWTQEVASQQHFDSIAREKQERATAILQQISERNLQFHREAHERLTTRAVGFDTLSDLARQRKDALKEVKKAWEKLITTPCAVSFVLGPGHLPTLLACLGQRHWEKSFSRRNVAPSRLLQMTDEQILRLVAEEDADASFGEARAFRLALQSIEAGKGIPQGCASKYFSVRPGEPAVLPSTLPFWSVGQVIAHFQTESESMKDLKFVSQECARLRISGAVLMSMSQEDIAVWMRSPEGSELSFHQVRALSSEVEALRS